MKRWGPVVLAIVEAMLFHACGPTTKIIKERTLSLDAVLQAVHARNERVKTLKGSGTITVESPEGSNSGFFSAQLKKPDSLRVEFRGPFGLNVGTLLLSRQKFVFFNRMENRAVIGKPDGRTLESMFRLNMQFDEILNAFTGEFPSATEHDSLSRFYVEDGFYFIRYNTDQGWKEYRVDGDAFVVTSYRVLDSAGTTILTASASRLDDGDTVSMPRLLRVVFPKQRRSITIAYDGVDINEQVECSFTLPDQAEVIYRR